MTNLPQLARLSGTAAMDLVVALPLRNAEGLTQLLREMYDPASPRYRQYLTPAQFAEQFGPAELDYQQLVAFAKAQGFAITQTHVNRTLLNIRGAVTEVERTFHVTLHTYRHPTEARFFHAPDVEPSLDLQVPILAVHGLDDYGTARPAGLHPMPQAQGTQPQAGSAPGGSYWGHDFRAAYLPGVTLSGAGQVVGLLEMDGYFTNDIAAYKTQAGLPDVPITNILISGYSGAAGSANSEVALDIEMALAMAPGLAAVAVYESTNTWTAYVSMLNRMATDNLAKQLSASWTWTGVPKTSLDTTFLQFAAQGQSFFNASGDTGAYPGTIPTPADDPYVTVVGGTTLTTSGPGGTWLSETTWSWFPSPADASSGGFSTSYTIPSWQAGVSMAGNQGSTTRRNLPDVALTADNIWVIYNNGGAGAFGGTSAASPLWAGLTALINQQMLAQGQPPVGFINPVIYALGTGTNYPAAFRDIVTGNNTNASSATKFSAVAGYDLCTGWGTPNGISLIQAFLLPPTVTTVTPATGPVAGGNSVIISGSNLGTGDVTSVTLCGIPATLVSDNSPSQLVVLAGAALAPGIGDVVVQSSSAGVVTRTNGYTYVPPAPLALAASGVTVSGFYANWTAVAGATNYLLDVSAVGDFSSYVPGYSNLTVGAVTTYRVLGLVMGSNYYYRVRAQQNGVSSDNSNGITVAVPSCDLSLSSGPSSGGNLLTITGLGLGDGTDIDSVTICGVTAVIQSQTANAVTVLVAAGGQGTGDIVIHSASQGTTTIKNGYTYQPPGYIFGAFQGWGSVSNLPATRAYLATASVNGKLYALGGYNGSYQSSAYVYDPLQPGAGWLSISNLPATRGYLAAAEVGGKLYAIGGYNGSYQNSVYVYDPQQPTAGWLSVSNLPATSGYVAAASGNGKLYVLGGYNGSYQSSVYVYDPQQPTAGWSSVSNLPATRRSLAAAWLNGKLYALGGYNGSYQNSAYVYDPQQPAAGWLSISNLPAASAFEGAATVNGTLYAVGGYNTSSSYQNSVYVYDPQQPAAGWLSASSLPATRRGLGVTGINGTLYAAGGYNGSYQATVYQGAFGAGVAPASGSRFGGTLVTITGSNLGAGDVTNVTLCGFPAGILTDNSPTQIVVLTSASLVPTNGDVVVYSTSCGATAKTGAYTYLDVYATLTVLANPASGGSVAGGGTFVVGSNVQITATASNNWVFTGWSDGDTNAARFVTVPLTNTTYLAGFSPTANISVGVGAGGGGVVTGSGTYIVGSLIQLTAVASNNWAFTGWSDGVTNNPRSIVVAAGGASYTASFSPTVLLTLQASPTNGGAVFGGGIYIVGSTQQVSAAASNGWLFTSWSDGDTNALRLITVPPSNSTYAASFGPAAKISVLASPTNGGAVFGGGTYLVGALAQLSAVASNSWAFTGWADGDTNALRAITVPPTNTSYTAHFAPTAPITVAVGLGGGGTVSGSGTYLVGANVQLVAVASNGWLFVGWGDGNTDNPRAIVVSGQGAVYTADFAPAVTVAGVANPADGGTVSGGGLCVVGSNVQLLALASTNWAFTSWADGDTNALRTITVPATNATYTANFSPTVVVTALASPANAGRAAGSGTYLVGSNALLTATASNGWLFTSWDGGVTNNPWTLIVPATNVTCTAAFAPAATIIVQPGTNAGGTVTGSGTFLVGGNDVLTATASNGWQFIQWNDGTTNNPRTIVVASNVNYTAVFAPTALLTVQALPPEGGSVTGGGTYVVGSNALLSATASNLWRFIQWNDGATNNPRTVVVLAGGATYTANFSPLGTVTTRAEPANGGSTAGDGQYIVGSNATVTAAASNSWLFLNWNGSTTNNPWAFAVTSGTTVCTANFAMISTVTVLANPANAGSVAGGGVYIVGSNATLSAVASNNWLFTKWDDNSALNPRTISVPPTNSTYTAFFAAAATISVGANTNAGGSVAGSGVFFVGSNDVLTATASNGWQFISWSDGVTNNPRTVAVLSGGAGFTAVFAPTAVLLVQANPANGGSVTGGGTYVVGSNAVLSATASNQWCFLSWQDGVTNAARSVTVPDGGAAYTANFAPLSSVTVLASPTNGGSVSGGGQYIVGSNAMVTAVASNGWLFTSWNGSVTNNPWLFSVPTSATVCTACFAKLSLVSVFASPTNGGSVSGGGNGIVGSNVTLAATAANNWTFTGWNDGNTNAVRSISVPATNIAFTATFMPPSTITVRANPAAGGNVSGGGSYLVGSNLALTAVANTGWSFLSWSDGVMRNPRSIVVPAAGATYTANFGSTAGLGAALEATNLNWTLGGIAAWYPETGTKHGTASAVQSGAIGTGQSSFIQVTTNGPASLQFWWKVSSAATNYLQFYINTQLVSQISGNVDWNQFVTFLGTSNQVTLTWVYTKNTSAVAGSDAGWVDQVMWMPCPYAEHVPQMFYQDPSGTLASWVLSSTGGFRFARVLANTGGWALKAAGDIDGDGVSDLLFQNAAGDTGGWFMNADGSVRDARFWFNIGAWEIKACGDYEGTGRGQLFFQTAAGDTAYWRLDTNGVYQSSQPLGLMAGWKLRGAGDLDGDHKAELFWQNAAGQIAIWYHNPDGSIRGAAPFNTGIWALCGVTDIDGDGVCDLLWQTPSGDTGGWFMNSNSTARAANFWWNTGAWKLKAAGR